MLNEFFQIGPIPSDQMIGSYAPTLVILSYLMATFASYIALDITGRLRDPSNTDADQLFWLLGGSIAMGSGIWSMHFIGMLSFSMPGMKMHYDLLWTILSLLVAIFASGFALSLLKSKTISLRHLIYGGIFLGLAIASMHYTGMHAMQSSMVIHYLPGLFFLSILIAILASEAALWLAIKSNQVVLKLRVRLKLVSAAIMGVAICGMHYTGMAAAVFTPHPSPSYIGVDPTILAVGIASVTFIILGVAFFASSYKEAMTQKELENARQLGMAEISASVLHNVGNVLNSVNVSTNILNEKIQTSQLIQLKELSNLINEQNDFKEFIAKDARADNIPKFINVLTKYWEDEQNLLTEEMERLRNNLHHIKEIISTQQGISKVNKVEQIIDINESLNEAILISGLNSNQYDIQLQKNYGKFKSILVDKVKLLQVLVNLFANAKDSLRMSANKNKVIEIQSLLNGDKKIQIKIRDTGVGISHNNINKIFNYGFTTKKSGHGFGLHTCALIINEMGGAIQVESEGENKGALFIVNLPYRVPKS